MKPGEKKEEEKSKKDALPKSIIEQYAPYRRKSTKVIHFLVANTKFEIEDQYEILELIGQGAYGIVCAARNKLAGEDEDDMLAIKKIEKTFEHKIFAKRTLRELKILRLLNHENIIGIDKIMLPKSREEFDDIYVCNELMENDLANIIRSPQPLYDEHIKFFMYQLLRGLKYLHSAGVIHRDLKPRNLLVNQNCDLKICDFGLARATNKKQTTSAMTDYVQTRWYRAPELLLSAKEYGPSVDMWSVGCILAELLNRKPLLPGTKAENQIEIIFETFGRPTNEEINNIKEEKLKKLIKDMPQKQVKPLNQTFKNASPEALDLLSKLMVFDPKKRLTAEEAISHPYFTALHFPDDEPTTDPLPAIEFEFENHQLSMAQLKDLMYEEILLYHFPDFAKEYLEKVEDGICPYDHIFKNENRLKPGEKDVDEYDEEDD